MARNEALFTAIAKGKRKEVGPLVQAELDGGAKPDDILNDTMIPAMRDVGEKFSRNEVYVPEMLIAARAMAAGLVIIEPLLTAKGIEPKGRVAIGTVKGDLHDIGKNLVVMMLKGAGYEVMDLGVDCPNEKYEEAVKNGAQALLLSALLTTTMPAMKDVLTYLKDKGIKVKTIIGGAPVTQEYANEIGADGYGRDANDAVKVVERVLAA